MILENSKTLEPLYLRGPTRFAVGNQRRSGTSLAFHEVGRKAFCTAPVSRLGNHLPSSPEMHLRDLAQSFLSVFGHNLSGSGFDPGRDSLWQSDPEVFTFPV